MYKLLQVPSPPYPSGPISNFFLSLLNFVRHLLGYIFLYPTICLGGCFGLVRLQFLPLPSRCACPNEEKLGDGTDAIAGIKGIGPAKALQLVKAYGSIPEMLKNVDKITDQQKKEMIASHAELLEKNLQLTSLRAGTVPNPFPLPLARGGTA